MSDHDGRFDDLPFDDLPIDPDLDPADPAEPSLAHHRATAPQSRAHPRVLLAIAAGGALGAPARYGVAQVITVRPDHFPWATFATNVSGSFALGFLLVLLIHRFPPTRYLRPFFATGFLGAFTTFSTFAVETDLLVSHGHAATAATYALASIVVGLGAVWVGIAGGRRVPVPARSR